MQRYFIEKNQVNKPFIKITGDYMHHMTRVMRMRVHDKVYFCDQETTYIASLETISQLELIFVIEEEFIEEKELPVNVTVCQGVVRKEKMEEVIDHITEMGASFYQPVVMDFCNIKLDNEKLEKKQVRFNTIAREAAEQSHRTKVLEVKPLIKFKALLEESKNFDLCLYAYEKSTNMDSLKTILKNNTYKNILVVVGPEGGISKEECKLMDDFNFKRISLGPRILRTEVAPVYFMAALSYELEN